MNKTALLLLADGAEEMETVIPIDILRRAGIKVTIAGVNGIKTVTCCNNLKIIPDVALENITDMYDAVIIPGGMSATEICAASREVGEQLTKHFENKKLIALISTSSLILQAHKVAIGSNITASASITKKLNTNYDCKDTTMVCDANLITSQGPANALNFSLCILEQLEGERKTQMLCDSLSFSK